MRKNKIKIIIPYAKQAINYKLEKNIVYLTINKIFLNYSISTISYQTLKISMNKYDFFKRSYYFIYINDVLFIGIKTLRKQTVYKER